MNAKVSSCTGRAVAWHLGGSSSGVNRGCREVFSCFWARTHPCALDVVSSRRRQKSQGWWYRCSWGVKAGAFRSCCCLFVNACFSISRGASEVWAVPVRPWVCGRWAARGSCCCCFPMVLFKFYFCHLQSEPVFSWAGLQLFSLVKWQNSIYYKNKPSFSSCCNQLNQLCN